MSVAILQPLSDDLLPANAITINNSDTKRTNIASHRYTENTPEKCTIIVPTIKLFLSALSTAALTNHSVETTSDSS